MKPSRKLKKYFKETIMFKSKYFVSREMTIVWNDYLNSGGKRSFESYVSKNYKRFINKD